MFRVTGIKNKTDKFKDMKLRNIVLGMVFLFMAQLSRAGERPNIIFIFADDLGWGDLGCYGHRQLRTPNLDQLAGDGMLLTDFYVASPVCAPSRVAIMTGRYPARYNVHKALTKDPEKNASFNMVNYLDPETTLLTRVLQDHGYTTGHFGKWHLGATDDAPPPGEYGIDVHYTINSTDVKLTVPRHKSSEVIIDQAIKFMESNRDEPFFMNVWTLVPHASLDPTPEQMEPYERFGAKRGAAKRGFSTPAQIYYSSVTDLDAHIGRLIDRVDELGLAEETIIVFSSDNGPEDIEVPAARHSGVGSPGPFRGRKRSLYDGGIRVPFIMRWDGHVPANTVNNQSVVGGVDLMPTFCSMAGVPLPEGYDSDGEDMSPVFVKNRDVEREEPLLWQWTWIQHGHPFNVSPKLALRDGKWKFLMNPDGSRIELYDLSAGPQPMELDNVADQHPELVERYKETLLEFDAELPEGIREERSGNNRYPMPRPSR